VVRVRGRMAHGAMPRSGINPNTRLARIILAFERFEVAEIRRCYTGRRGEAVTLATKYGVSLTTMHQVIRRQWWRHVA